MCYRIGNLFGSLHKCIYLKIFSPHIKVQPPKLFFLSKLSSSEIPVFWFLKSVSQKCVSMQYLRQKLPKPWTLQTTDWPQTKEAITSLIVWAIPILSLFYCTSSSCSLSYDRSTAFSKAVFYTVRSRTSSFNLQYLLVFLRPSSSCLCLLPRLPIPSIFPSIMHIRWQTLHKMWPIQLAFLCFNCTYL